MKLYIANSSTQAHTFNFKIPEKTQSFGVTIKPGQQHAFEFPPEVVEHIIRQHEPYGLQPRNRVDSNFSGLCYSTDRAITATEIIDNSEQKKENLDDMSQSILEASAVTLNNKLEAAAIQGGDTLKGDSVLMEIKGEAVNQDQDNPAKLDKKVQVKK